MKRFLLLVALIVVAVVLLGVYQGWLRTDVERSDGRWNVSVEIDEKQLKGERDEYLKKAETRLREFSDRLTRARSDVEKLPPESRQEREIELSRLEERRDAADQQIRDLRDAPEDGWDDLRVHIDEALDDISRGAERVDSYVRDKLNMP